MKKYFFLSLLTLLLCVGSCKKEKVESKEKKEITTSYSIDADNSSMEWTAYKTSEKVPVKGTFTKVNIVKSSAASSKIEAINGLEFEIPVASIFSKDSIRDGKLNTFFFAIMENTLKLKGGFSVSSKNQGVINLTMNGMTKELPFEYNIQGDIIEVNATMNLDHWQAQAALASLNEACNLLHTGADGVAKTWNDVTIKAQIKTLLAK